MLWGRAQAFKRFNLGMAPLSGLEEHALAPAWHKLGRMVQRYGETFYNFEGLRKFQGEIRPRSGALAIWRRPTVSPWPAAPPDVTAIISGGVRNVLWK